jgi:hypothetical protein
MKIIDDLLKKAKITWLNPFRLFAPEMVHLMGSKCWWETPAIVHPLPILVTLLGTILLIYLPEDILSRCPTLKGFTDLMGMLIPGIPAYAENTGSQAVLLVHAMNWVFVPYWLWLTFKVWPVFNFIFKLVGWVEGLAETQHRLTRTVFVGFTNPAYKRIVFCVFITKTIKPTTSQK